MAGNDFMNFSLCELEIFFFGRYCCFNYPETKNVRRSRFQS